jgi:hypothetical protein
LTTTYVNWGGSRVKLTWENNDKLPQNNLVTSVHGFCFQNKKLLLVDLNQRGWDRKVFYTINYQQYSLAWPVKRKAQAHCLAPTATCARQ